MINHGDVDRCDHWNSMSVSCGKNIELMQVINTVNVLKIKNLKRSKQSLKPSVMFTHPKSANCI